MERARQGARPPAANDRFVRPHDLPTAGETTYGPRCQWTFAILRLIPARLRAGNLALVLGVTMNEKWSKFFALPSHLTADYIGGVIMGMGIGCIFGSAWVHSPTPRSLVYTSFALMITGCVIRWLGARRNGVTRNT